jgi:hypothetical protein
LLLLKPKVLLAPERQRAEESTEAAILTLWGRKTEREKPEQQQHSKNTKHNNYRIGRAQNLVTTTTIANHCD